MTVDDRADAATAGRPWAGWRVAVASTVGVVVFPVAMFVGPPAASWQVSVIVAWIACAGVFLAWVWRSIRGADAQRTAALATLEDPSRLTAELLLVAASGASVVAVALALIQANSDTSVVRNFTAAIAAVCLVVSWTTVNTVYTLRYARLYYGEEPGGIAFGEENERPTYADFAYLAFTIGMTYQVSDTPLGSREMRATALRHALLSFVFVTSVVAMTINIVAQLFSRRA
jgi:uncharacterized membrane protein